MRDSNEHATTNTSAIQCLEVLISRKVLDHNLQWTLSVYSLENQPVQRIATMENSVIYHFMVFDWRRTIKKLLDDNLVPYSVIQYFNPRSVYSESVRSESFPTGLYACGGKADYLATTTVPHAPEGAECSSIFSKLPRQEPVELILDEEGH